MHTPKSKDTEIPVEKTEEKLIAKQEEMEQNSTSGHLDRKGSKIIIIFKIIKLVSFYTVLLPIL